MNIPSLLSGYSKALYSTWVWYKPDHLLIDCGEGCASALGNSGFAIERVLLTHGHIDHIAGLPPLLWSRAGGMGDNQKPLAIYYPRDDFYVADMKAYLERTSARLPFALNWIALDAGDSFPLHMSTHAGREDGTRANHHARRIETFATRHIKDRLTLGYKIVETRRRLKPEYAALSQAELRRMAQENRARKPDRSVTPVECDTTLHDESATANDSVNGARMTEEYDAILAAFGGDGLPLDVDAVRGSELLLHEATILEESERRHQWHSTLDEAVQVAAQVKPKAFVLQHISGRYGASEVASAACRSAARHGVEFPIWCLFRDRLWNVWGPPATRIPAK